jgi:hypothetical protein
MAPRTNKMYTPSRAPIERAEQGVTIDEIEDRVAEIYPDYSLEARRSLSLLFAILKQGASLQKLQWFTRYQTEFIGGRLDALRSAGLIFTGTLGARYVLAQVPHCEDLVERITGQRIVAEPAATPPAPLGDWEKNLVKPAAASSPPRPAAKTINRINRKDEPMNTVTAVNGAVAEAEGVQPTCLKTPGCPRPAGHNGICKGQKVNRRAAAEKPRRSKTDPPEAQRAANAERMRLARAESKSYGRGSKAAPAATTADRAGYFKIEFEDGEDTISREGHGRDGFARALKALYQEFAGGSNG